MRVSTREYLEYQELKRLSTLEYLEYQKMNRLVLGGTGTLTTF